MNAKGTILLITIFITFILTTLGFGLLILSQIHSKISVYSKYTLCNQYASECGIKEGVEDLIQILNSSSLCSNLSEEKIDYFRKDIQKGGFKIIEYLLGYPLPLCKKNTWKKYNWQRELSFSLKGFLNYEEFTHAKYNLKLKSVGWINASNSSSASMLKGELELLAGKIPLSFFPVLVEEKPESNFIENEGLEVINPEKNLFNQKVYFSEINLIPDIADAQLLKAFNIKHFYPYKLSYLELRRAIGLEEINEPIPLGVYLIQNDLGLGGIYVEGDLEQMVLAIKENFQVIGFFTEQGTWILKFSPELSKTIFKTPSEIQFYDLTPLGIIIINGKVHSLGGGTVNSDGIPILCKSQEIPSVLKGLNLSIISSDKIEISSHLILQGVKWENGIPYIKEKVETQLILFSTGKDFFNEEEKQGGIIINENSPNELKVQASLISSKSGIKIKGDNKEVLIFGSLQASSLNINNNEIKIIYDNRLKRKEFSFGDYPLSASSIILISSCNILYWKELQ
jgi:hypothetical protein